MPERDDIDPVLEQWRRERPELDPSPIGIVGRVSRLARELEARLEPVYRKHGLEGGGHDVLATLRRSGPPFRMRPTDLTKAVMLTSSGTTKRLDRLERVGLIAREPDPQDRRGTLIALTAKGREAIDATTADHFANERRLLAALSPAEQQQLADLLRRLRLGLPRLMEIELFTDPACPFAFSAEPIRWRLRWHYGDQLTWRLTMIVLTLEPGEAEKLAEGAPNLQRRFGMPIDPAPYPRPASSEPACRAVVAARLNAPGAEDALLRRLRVRVMAGGLIDDPALIAGAAADAGLDPAELARWCATPAVQDALEANIRRARSPSPAARALGHKLGGPPGERRYTAPSYEIDGFALPGFHPVEAYEAAIANRAPALVRRPRPATVEELLEWAGEPLATAEVVMVTGLDPAVARAALARAARPIPAGADCYWTRVDSM